MNKKVAISIWNRRVSPVMDTASQLLVFKIDDETNEIFKEIVSIPQANISGRIRYFLSLKLEILICGAISNHFEQALRVSGIRVVPFLRGNVDDIIAGLSTGSFHVDNFLLPGCRRNRRRGRKYIN